jgi:hypothetical protein
MTDTPAPQPTPASPQGKVPPRVPSTYLGSNPRPYPSRRTSSWKQGSPQRSSAPQAPGTPRPQGSRPPGSGRKAYGGGHKRNETKHVNHVPTKAGRFDTAIPSLAPRTVRIIPLGGVEEIGRNMTAIEYEGNIIVVDCGLSFPEGDTPGVDYILPNTGYLEDNKERIVGMLITHGHLDHIGGIPYVIEAIGNPTI